MSNSLITIGDFTLHSGDKSNYLIDSNALSDNTLKNIAYLVSKKFNFGKVWGIPNGGNRFAAALTSYIFAPSNIFLIVDDVYTTGASMEEAKQIVIANKWAEESKIDGLVLFNRGEWDYMPAWITSIFSINSGVLR